MAQLGVAGAGAVIGGVIGTFAGGNTLLGAQIGWAIGGVAGALLFPPKGPDTTGPRLNDLSVQTSGYGVPIPIVAGRTKLAGNVIWKTDLRETVTRRRQGKGGQTARTTTYTYSLSWAVGLCEWLIPPTSAQVLRIWLDAKLVYDATGASAVAQIPGLTWRFHDGSEDQLPDPLLAATLGADAPAHRGLAYIVFDDVPLAEFGNRMPNVTVEISANTTSTFPQVNSVAPAATLFTSSPSNLIYANLWPSAVAVDYARGRVYEGRKRTAGATSSADTLIRVYDLLTMQGIAEYSVDQIVAPVMGGAGGPPNAAPGVLHMGADGFLYMTGGGSNFGGVRPPLWKIDPDSMRAVSWFGTRTGDSFFLTDSETSLTNPLSITSFQVQRLGATPRTFVVVSSYRSAMYTVDADNTTGAPMAYVWGRVGSISPPGISNGYSILPLAYEHAIVAGRQSEQGTDVYWVQSKYDLTPKRVEVVRHTYGAGAASLGGGAAMGIVQHPKVTIDINAEVDASASRIVLQSAWWDEADNTLVITISGAGGPASTWSRFSTFKVAPDGTVLWTLVDHAMPARSDARGDMRRVFGGLWGLGAGPVLFPATGDVLLSPAGGDFNTLSWVDEQQAVIGFRASGGGAQEIAKRFLVRSSPNNLTVGAIVTALCERAGLSAADINVSALSDSIRGYTLGRPTSARDAITPLGAAWQFDAVEQDDILVFRKRGGALVATLDYADLVRESPDGMVMEEQRVQDADLPRELTVRYIDIDRDYEQNAQSARRPSAPIAVTGANASSGFDLPIPLTANEAKTVARRMMTGTWRERTRIVAAVGPQFLRLVPTDPVIVTTRDGAAIRCRVITVQLGANWVTRVELVTEDAATYALTAAGDNGEAYQPGSMPAPYFARLILPDMALVSDADDTGGNGLREYAAIGAYDGQTFRGVDHFRSPDTAVWTRLDRAVRSVTWGAVSAISGTPVSPWLWDEITQIDVVLNNGEVDGATSLEVLNGANIGALIGADGRAEIFQWRDAVALGGSAYRLSGLLRGRRGTEDLIASRAPGDVFVALDANLLRFEALAAEAAAVRFHRGVTIYDTVETAPATVTKAARGRAERPYAPVQVAGARDGSNNLTITWVRRTRVGGEWLDGTGTVPVSEAAEAYEVEILNGGTVVRTIAPLSSASATYLASQQTSDFGSPRPSVSVRVYQISAQVGRGIAAEATV